uniref:Tetraspanin n=1 Tax=Mastacembelus armatus TaxID=205130 RepID=A0A7N8Y879_9TELE
MYSTFPVILTLLVSFLKKHTLRTNILVSGAILMAVGIWVTVDAGSFLRVLGPFSHQQTHFMNVSILCISIGAVLVLLGLLGCIGAHKESKCLLLMVGFFSIIVLIFIAELAAAVVALAFSSITSLPILLCCTDVFSFLFQLRCCGVTNYTDFMGSKFEQQNGGMFPPSCCSTNVTSCSRNQAETSGVQGCFNSILETLRKNSNIVGAIAAGIGILEIAAMGVSMYLYCHLADRVS